MTVTIRSAVPGDAVLIIRFIADLAGIREAVARGQGERGRYLARPVRGCAEGCSARLPSMRGGRSALRCGSTPTRPSRTARHLARGSVRRSGGAGAGDRQGASCRTWRSACVREGLGRFEWWVLDWNEPSINFYKAQGRGDAGRVDQRCASRVRRWLSWVHRERADRDDCGGGRERGDRAEGRSRGGCRRISRISSAPRWASR